jgi:hypothetical protein
MEILTDKPQVNAPAGFRYFTLKLPIDLYNEISEVSVQRTCSRQAVIFDWLFWGRKADPRKTDKPA